MSSQGQPIVEIRDFRQFAIDFAESRGKLRMDANNADTSEGVNLGPADGTASGGPFYHGIYLQITDTYLWIMQADKNDSGTATRNIYSFVYAHDAMLQNPDAGWWQPMTYNPLAGSSSQNFDYFGNTSAHRFIVGQPNMRTLEQYFYWNQNSDWTRYNAHDASTVDVDIWPNIGQSLLANATDDPNVPGYWSPTEATNTANYSAIVFEGITDTSDGMPGETDPEAGILRGDSTHPEGLMLAYSVDYNFEGSGVGGNDHDSAWLWVDIDTGLAVGKLGVTARRDSDGNTSPPHPQQWLGPSMDKRGGFPLSRVQFVPDPDTAFDRPKGELHFFWIDQASYTVTNREIFEPDGTSFTPAEAVQQFYQVVDFNPFNQTIGPERVHNRILEEGHFVVPYDPLLPGGAVSLVENSGSRHNRIGPNIYYHPPSRTYCNAQASYADANNDGTGQPLADSHRFIRYARDNKADAVSIPADDAAVIENGAAYLDVYVQTELGQPVQNHTVYFQTYRLSTRAETFDGTGQGASAYIVAQGVIDNDTFLDVREGNDVDNGGTLLVEGVDYTVTYGTGTLTPVGSWPTDAIYVRYRHRSAEVNPGFGTLQAASAVTDLDGKATAIIMLDDNLDGELVGLNVDTETPF